MSLASHEFRGSVDFNQNELRNATFQNLITPPIGPVQGQIYFDSRLDLKSPYYWNSTEWIPFGLKPVHKKYTDETAMLAGQLYQISGYIYHNEALNIYYEKLPFSTGNISDYNPFGGLGLRRDAGAGLSIDVDNKIQLGNAGSGYIDVSDTLVFEEGLSVVYNNNGYFNKLALIEGEIKSQSDWDDGINYYDTSIKVESSVSGNSLQFKKEKNGIYQLLDFNVSSDLIQITDQINSKGLEYFSDYEANFTARSLVTKQYVTSAIGAINVLATPLTGYVVGANTILSATDTILQAFQKTQGQINARVSGTIASGQVAFGTGVNTIGGENALFWDVTNDRLGIGTATPSNDIEVRKSAQINLQLAYTGQTSLTLSAVISGESRISAGGGTSFLTLYTGGTEKFRLTNAGFVGIGVVPTAKLHVVGTDFPVITTERTTASTTGFVSSNYFLTKTSGDMSSGFGGGLVFAFQDNTYTPTSANSQVKIYPYIDGGDIMGAFSFRGGSNGNTSLLELRSSGFVGINTISPTDYLDVNGTVRIRTISNGTGDFLTKSATGVITSRTSAEVLTDIGAEPAFSKGSLIAGTNVTLDGTLTDRLVGTGDVTINATIPAGSVPIDEGFTYVASNVFSLAYADPTVMWVALNGQIQRKGILFDWTVSGTSLTITTPLRAGDEILIQYYTSLTSVINYSRNIDGGAPDSVYLAIQNVDGGTP